MNAPDTHGLQQRIGEFADAHRHVDALFDNTDHGVQKQALRVNLGILLQVAHQDGRDAGLAEQHRRRQREGAAWGGMRAGRDRLGLFDVGQDAAAVLSEPGAGVSDPHHARGAGEQAQTQAFFQFSHRPRTTGGDRLFLRAALAMPPLSTTATNVVMACRRPMLFRIQKGCLGWHRNSPRSRHHAKSVCQPDLSPEP